MSNPERCMSWLTRAEKSSLINNRVLAFLNRRNVSISIFKYIFYFLGILNESIWLLTLSIDLPLPLAIFPLPLFHTDIFYEIYIVNYIGHWPAKVFPNGLIRLLTLSIDLPLAMFHLPLFQADIFSEIAVNSVHRITLN